MGEPQKLSGGPSRPVVAWLASARESFVQAVSVSMCILFLPGRSPSPGKGRILVAKGPWGPALQH